MIKAKKDNPLKTFGSSMKKDIRRTRWVNRVALGKLMAMVLVFSLAFGLFFLLTDAGIAKILQWLGVNA